MKNSILVFLMAGLLLQSCSGKKSSLTVKSIIKQKQGLIPSLHEVAFHNEKITVKGGGFAKVKTLKLKGNGLDVEFKVDSADDTQVVASALSDFHIPLDGVFNLIIGTVDAQSTYPVIVQLDDHSIDLTKLKVSSGANGFASGSILKFDGRNWVAGSLPNSQIYLGTWNAGTNTPNLSDGQFLNGDYYIVTTAGTYNSVSYQVGDWVMFDGSNWGKINNSSNVVSSFQGRRGVVTLTPVDYAYLLNDNAKIPNSSLNHLSDVDLTTVQPISGKVLKYNGTKWVAGDVATGGANSVGTTDLQDSSVTAAKLNLADESIAQSKITNLRTDLAGKQPLIAVGTATQYFRGDKSWATLDSSVVPENTNLYFTNARALGVPLTGFTTNNSAITASDTILSAFGKTQGQLNSFASNSGNFLIKNGNDSISGQVTVDSVTGSLKIPTTPSGLDLTDAANVQYVKNLTDTKLNLSGGTLTGNLQINSDVQFKDSNTNKISIRAPGAVSSSYTLTLPTAVGSNNQVLATDGTGNLSWTTPATSATPAGNAGGDLSGTYPNPTISGLNATKIGAGTVSNSEFGYLTGVTSSIQSQLSSKLNSTSFVDWSTTGAQTIDLSRINLTTTNRVVVTNASSNLSASTVTTTELGYLSGATSNIQTQLNGKLSAETDPSVLAFAKAALPACGAGEVLKSNGTSFTCVTDNAGAGAYAGTQNRMVLTDGSTGALTTSSVTNTEAGYLSGVTSAIQTQLNSKQNSISKTTVQDVSKLRVYGANSTNFVEISAGTLTANHSLIFPDSNGTSGQYLSTDGSGNLSWATPVGGVTSVNTLTGAVTLTTTNVSEGTNAYFTNARAIGAPLTGYATGANTALSASDSILSGMQKLEGQIASKQGFVTAGTTAQYYRGDKTWATLDSSVVPENTNLYFTNSRALGVPLTGFDNTLTGAIAATDTILQAFGKTQNQLNAKLSSGSFVDWSTSGLQTIDPSRLTLGAGNASKAMVTSSTGAITASSVTSTELGYLSGVTSAIQTQLNAKQATISKTTVQDVSKLRVYGANSTNYVEISAGTLSANLSFILPTSGGTSGQYLSTDGAGNLSWSTPVGGVTSVNTLTGAVTLTTTNVSEGTNQYYTNARGIASTITTPTLTNSAIAANDSIQTALGKLQAQFNNVLSAVLTGLSTATNSAITATDSILVSFGKLQAQISAHTTSIAGKADQTNLTQTITAATVTGLSTPVVGSDAANKTYVDGLSYWTNSSGNIYRSSGNVGIGTSAPGAPLDVKGAIRLSGSTSGYAGFQPAAAAGSTVWTLPSSDGSANQVLGTNGAGVLSWMTAGGGSNSLTPSSQTTNFSITSSNLNYVFLVNPSAGTATATLPSITTVSAGFRVLVKRSGFGFVNVAAASGETIEGSAVRSIDFQGGIMELMATTTGWELLRAASSVSSSSLCTEGNITYTSPGESSLTISQNMVDYCKFSISIQGGGGGNASSTTNGGLGGAGGGVQFNWTPTATGTLGVYVGGGGSSSGGGGLGAGAAGCRNSTTGGGGGGGASAMTFTSGTSTLLAIAGGGGGGGYIGAGGIGGSGGSAGSNGAGTYGGAGGGNNIGGTGGYSGSTVGGAGGSSIANGSTSGTYCGVLGGTKIATYSISGGGGGGGYNGTTNTGAGGGGGGYGGGGGAGATNANSTLTSGGGGGGGYINTALATSIQSIAGSAAGTDGKIIIYWTAR